MRAQQKEGRRKKKKESIWGMKTYLESSMKAWRGSDEAGRCRGGDEVAVTRRRQSTHVDVYKYLIFDICIFFLDLGLRQSRLEGDEYLAIVDEFMEAAFARWPKAVIQFEDFQMKWAFETLQRYRENFCMFNDDIQGTAGVALAGLLGSVRAQGRSLNDFMKQKIVVVGAGRYAKSMIVALVTYEIKSTKIHEHHS
ncbi:hypothetical protein ZIOFF_018252 [Zingiber officinale]|uniref:Malic enzyme n=1 Tax=Zingiber officinale TaxID=94328 RepID=A0A8J5HCQ4_ZINOF|nr:hypothetical protein ZIOFF_018252 [Zingiber officinale]